MLRLWAMTLSLVCPSRYRPSQLLAMARSAYDTAGDPGHVELTVYVDDDDDWGAYRRALRAIEAALNLRPVLTIGPRCTLSDAWNRAAEKATGDVLMLCADDLIFRTPGWDVMVLDAFDAYPDRIALVYGRDGVSDRPTHPFIHRRWYEAVGRMTTPDFPADYCDTWLADVADLVGRRHFLPDVLIEHMHYSVGKSERDACHDERLARAEGADLPLRYAEGWSERGREADALRAVMVKP